MGQLRAYRPTDFPALVLLVKELFDHHRQLQGAPLLTSQEAEETAKCWIEQPEVLVYAESENVVGAARLRWEQECPFLEELVVLTEWRKQGIGTAFLEAIEEHVRQRGADALFLSKVWLGNLSALDFYLKRGYNLLNTIELRKDFGADRRGRAVSIVGRTMYLGDNVPEE